MTDAELRQHNSQLLEQLADARQARNLYKPIALAAIEMLKAQIARDDAAKKLDRLAADLVGALAKQSERNKEL